MVSRPSLRAIVFDLDGTLIDSAPDIAAAVNTVLAESGRPELSLDDVRGMVGDGTRALVERAFAAAGGGRVPDGAAMAAPLARFRDIYEAGITERTTAYPGAAAALARLHGAGMRLGVCTNKPDRPARTILSALGLSRYLHAVIGGDTTPARKPDPRHLAAVLDMMEVRPEAAVMVGDGPNDVAVARALGVPVVLVSFGYSKAPVQGLGADAMIEDFARLAGALESLGAAAG